MWQACLESSVEELWASAPKAQFAFDPASIAQLPEPARRYLLHALVPGAPLATAARIQMQGSMRIDGAWWPFEATQILRWDRGFIWRARVRLRGMPVIGFDRFLDGEGAMNWRVLGLVPLVTAEGADVTRSAAGRLHAESIWLPPVLLGQDVVWEATDADHTTALLSAHGEESRLELTIDDKGALRSLRMPRWGDDGEGGFHYEDFGGRCEAERTFDGITIPSRLRVGWHFGSPRFESEGEFFRCTLDTVEYR